VPWATYVLTQFPALFHYLHLAIWPHPLIFYYPVHWTTPSEAAPYAIATAALIGGIAYALIRRWPIGFRGAWFLAVLASTSLIPGSGQTIAEHRMYLALAPLVVAGVVALFRAGAALRNRWANAGVAASLTGIALVFIVATAERNRAYGSELALWRDTAAHSPDNPLAECNIGVAYAALGDNRAARVQFEKALAIFPEFSNALVNLGSLARSEGRPAEALPYYERALRAKPDLAEALIDLGAACAELGRTGEAIAAYQKALALRPDYGEVDFNLGNLYAQSGRPIQAIGAYEAALRIRPELAEGELNLANVLLGLGRRKEAIAHYEAALRLRPGYADARADLAIALNPQVRGMEAPPRR
jgi:tetratricopeptide (TPR) repeat protein